VDSGRQTEFRKKLARCNKDTGYRKRVTLSLAMAVLHFLVHGSGPLIPRVPSKQAMPQPTACTCRCLDTDVSSCADGQPAAPHYH
jgi:hypothetical protein